MQKVGWAGRGEGSREEELKKSSINWGECSGVDGGWVEGWGGADSGVTVISSSLK